jgi:predicted nucleotidyltransferase
MPRVYPSTIVPTRMKWLGTDVLLPEGRLVPVDRRLQEKREAILGIARKHGATNVRVFGSVARGDDQATSDIDLLVSFAPGGGLLRHAALVRELEALLGRKVDVVSDKGLRPRVKDRIMKEAVAL